MLTDSNIIIIIIIITTLPESYFALTKVVLKAGKYIIVKKLFIPTSQEANILVKIVKEIGKLLTVY